jgi:arginyl-tRNA synthetase
MGDVGIPMFPFAKALRMAPVLIAAKAAALIAENGAAREAGEFFAAGPYLNVRLNKSAATALILEKIGVEGASYGRFDRQDAVGKVPLAGRRVMVEFSSPNTNKPLHLGHLRNDALGESVSRILKATGADVFKVCIINNRGVHICKTMLAYRKFHANKPDGTSDDTPESLGIKSDRFVGNCYVEFDKYSKTAGGEAEKEAQSLLIDWEKGNPEVLALWKQMNGWAIEGITQTYKRTGVSFDKQYFESDTYKLGKDEVLRGLEQGIFYRDADGSVRVDLAEINLDNKVLLRGDGTSIYITQDIGLAISRHADWDFNQLVYVVGSEQQWHFKVLFYILKKLGYAWADKLFHLSYGMVNLPEGKMKSREGTVVDADDLIDSLRDGALEEIEAKGREEAVGDSLAVAEQIAIGALHYYLLQTSPAKDMLFNPAESLSFNGNTGPYLQYMGARISSILRKAKADASFDTKFDSDTDTGWRNAPLCASLLTDDTEGELIKLLELFPATTARAAENLDPSLLVNYLYDVAKAFGKFYHDCPILGADNRALKCVRLNLAVCTRDVLKNGMELILVPFLETM